MQARGSHLFDAASWVEGWERWLAAAVDVYVSGRDAPADVDGRARALHVIASSHCS